MVLRWSAGNDRMRKDLRDHQREDDGLAERAYAQVARRGRDELGHASGHRDERRREEPDRGAEHEAAAGSEGEGAAEDVCGVGLVATREGLRHADRGRGCEGAAGVSRARRQGMGQCGDALAAPVRKKK